MRPRPFFTFLLTQCMKITNFLALLLVAFFWQVSANAQVTIGSSIAPAKGAILDLKHFEATTDNQTSTKGLLMPRVKLVDKESLAPTVSDSDPDLVLMKKNHQGLTVFHIGSDSMEPGIYVWDGESWTSTSGGDSAEAKWFYMPGFPIDVSQDIELSVNLYDEYKRQFGRVPSFEVVEKGKLKFAILGYDVNSFSSVSIDATTSVLKYKANPASIGSKSYLNIICQIVQ